MTTTPKALQALIDRQQYIKRAKITFNGDYARVASQTDENRTHPVRIVDGKAVRCECEDYFYRGRKTGKTCKHMEAVNLRIEKDAAKAARKAAKAARSAELVASLQVAEGVKVRKTRGQATIVVKVSIAAHVEEPTTSPQEAPVVALECPEMTDEDRAFQAMLAEPDVFEPDPVLMAALSGPVKSRSMLHLSIHEDGSVTVHEVPEVFKQPRKPVSSGAVRGNLGNSQGFQLMR